ncbi:MAG: PEGA domain-containing protein [Myxococcales bacterium]|nr:PEGA domain-containing protein [Myxococcales bacterium]
MFRSTVHPGIAVVSRWLTIAVIAAGGLIPSLVQAQQGSAATTAAQPTTTPPTSAAPSAAAPAASAPAAPPTAKATQPQQQAEVFSQAGRQAYRSAHYEAAYDAFARAFQHHPKPGYLYNMARCQEKLAKYGKAVRLLQRYLAVYRKQNAGKAPANVADVNNLIRTLRERAFEALPEVVIGTNPSGATVAIMPGGKILGSSPVVTHLKPGTYLLKIARAKYTTLETKLVVPESGKVRAVFSLKPVVRLAALSFWCNVRGAKIAVDGKVVAVTPFSGRIDVAPGRHQVSVQRRGYGPVEEIVSVPENKQLHINYVLDLIDSSSSWRTVLGWPILIAGLGGVGGGVWSRTQADEQYAGSPRFKLYEKYQNWGYQGGGAAIALGLGLVIWDGLRTGIPSEDRVGGVARTQGKTLRTMGEPATKGGK